MGSKCRSPSCHRQIQAATCSYGRCNSCCLQYQRETNQKCGYQGHRPKPNAGQHSTPTWTPPPGVATRCWRRVDAIHSDAPQPHRYREGRTTSGGRKPLPKPLLHRYFHVVQGMSFVTNPLTLRLPWDEGRRSPSEIPRARDRYVPRYRVKPAWRPAPADGSAAGRICADLQ